ncbi:MAG: NTP transferase domain-containing protein [Candidatus Moraniibacteriota bacterium]|nr:MAG: NTP transferase domain-containing protein [Candidatus Moranbacteria bacterium]
MKGIILAGGNGTRLLPLTAIASKQLLPVYDRPMIFYPLNTLIAAGIRDVLIIVSPEHAGNYLNLLGSLLRKHGVNISFIVQKEPRGLAEAFILGEDFIDNGPCTMILGDNLFEGDFSEAIQSFERGGRIFAKVVPDPERFGVVEFDPATGTVLSIVEKPIVPKSHYAIPGLYIYDAEVVRIAKGLKPSARGEIEITDLHNYYLEQGTLDVRVIAGAWFDVGTHDSLLDASLYVREKDFRAHFHPMIEEALAEYNQEFKRLVSL